MSAYMFVCTDLAANVWTPLTPAMLGGVGGGGGGLTDTQLRASAVPVSLSAVPLAAGAAADATIVAMSAKLPASLGAKAAAASLSVTTATDQATGYAALPSATFTRPANTTAYASGQLVANNTAAGSVVPMALAVARNAGAASMVRRARLVTNSTSLTNASFRLHLFSAAPTVSAGDGAALACTGAATYLGAIDITLTLAATDGAVGHGAPIAGSDITIPGGTGTVYGLLEARGAYTPTSGGSFAVALDLLQA